MAGTEKACSPAPNRVNSSHWSTKENNKTSIFCIFHAHGENCLKWHETAPGFFYYPDLAGILGRTNLGFEICSFVFLDSKFLTLQVSRFPEVWPGPGLDRAWARDSWRTALRQLLGSSAASPPQLRTTKLGRSKELGQYHENPISASPVWGMLRAQRAREPPK